MPTHFRWLWYLVGLAGMALAVVGLLAMIGSIVSDGLILPALGVVGVGLGYVLVRYRRRPRRADTAGVTASSPVTAAAVDDGSVDPTAGATAHLNPAATPAKSRRPDPGRTSRR